MGGSKHRTDTEELPREFRLPWSSQGEIGVADDKTNRGQQDRARVSGSETYEVGCFAEKHGLTAEQVRDLIDRHGNDRETLDLSAARLAAGQ